MSSEDFAPALLVGAVVVLVGVLAVRVASRLGLPSLLIFLGLGLALGESGLGIEFESADLTQVLGLTALAVILAEGGLTTRWTSARAVLGPGVVLATLGVAVSVGLTAGVVMLVFGFDLPTALLFGAVVSSTDAAAVFATLRRLGLPTRVSRTLELESGFNDAPAVLLVIALSETLADSGTSATPTPVLMALIGYQLVAGAFIGILIGVAGAWLLRRSALPVSGLYPLATVALCLTAYATAIVGHASGFLAVYVCGLVLGNSKLPHRAATLGFVEGMAWLAQIGLFVLLGLLASPNRLLGVLVPAIVVGLALLLLARPISVVLSVSWFKVPWREQVFLSWAGLRGAVPIVFATIPISAEVPGAERVFDSVFVLVVVFTVVQGTTLPTVARWLGLSNGLPEREVEVESATLEELNAELVQLTVPASSRLHGVYVSELRLPADAALTLLVRDGHSFVPDATTRLVRGDQLLVVTTLKSRQATMARLRAVSRGGRLARWRGESGGQLAD